jgi:hypothetical protein
MFTRASLDVRFLFAFYLSGKISLGLNVFIHDTKMKKLFKNPGKKYVLGWSVGIFSILILSLSYFACDNYLRSQDILNNSFFVALRASHKPQKKIIILSLSQTKEKKSAVRIGWNTNIMDGFEFYRSNSLDSEWVKINAKSNVSSSGAIIDNQPPKGVKTLYYKIVVVSAEGNKIYESEIKSISLESTDSPNYSMLMMEPFQKSDDLGYYGTLTLTGYLNIRTRVCDENSPCFKTVKYATFVFSSSDNIMIYDYLNTSRGNAFVSAGEIGLGCYEIENNRIYSENEGDTGAVHNIVSGPDLARLIYSDKMSQVKLQLTKPVYTSGRGAPDCYSHFRSFKVVE